MKAKCVYCGKEITNEKDLGYLAELDDSEMSRMKELKLNKGEAVCMDCKKEMMYAQLIPTLIM